MASSRFAAVKSLIKWLTAILLIGGTYYYFNSYHKEELDKFYLKFDTWGITAVGKAELDRQNEIDALSDDDKSVTTPQLDALKNRTVFLGATAKMVTLALGKPADEPKVNASGQQVWAYTFGDYSRPTYLYFENHNNVWVLTKAEKSGRY